MERAEKYQQPLTSLSGTVEDVIFRNAENGYTVLSLDAGGELVGVVGILGDVADGERLKLLGNYINSAKYGRQFKAETCERLMPETPEEMRRYLGSGILRGVGPSLAKRIVSAFGDDTLNVIENKPEMLAQLKGITADRAHYICDEFRRLCSVRNVIEFLGKYRVGPAIAINVWKRYENESVSEIQNNPFLLCDSGIELDFMEVDGIARELGFSEQNINRVRAGISYVLRENGFAGHTCLPRKKLADCVVQNLGVDDDIFEEAFQKGIDENLFVLVTVREREYAYLSEFYQAEKYIVDKITTMLKLNIGSKKDFSEEIAGVEWSENIQYETLQKAAINGCLGNNLFILTGGPGTGKTTTLNAVIRLCKAKKKSLVLAAPTGRAAKRMSDLTGETAKTIHRLLEVDFSREDKLSFKHNELNPIKADIIIIDEMSMVDELLFEALLRAVKTDSKLIMVGDANQLPSVGAGNILRDLVASGHIPTVELKEIFRQAAESLIITNAHKIVRGEAPELDIRNKDFFFMPVPSEEDIPRLIIDLTKTRLPATYGFSPIDDIQILTPTRMGVVGTRELNKQLQLALNPPSRTKQELKYFDSVFRKGDKIMQIKNDYDVMWSKGGEKGSGVFNGDIGIIKDVDAHNQILTLDFDGRIATYNSEMLAKLEHAYAITIHKSQGSEYDAVIIPMTGYAKQLLYRNLLYTGVTRAKKILIIIGKKSLVTEMVSNDRKTLRYSCIRAMLDERLSQSDV